MQVKGTSLLSTQDFVKETFQDKYDDFITSLPEESKEIFKNIILPSKWYPSQEGLIKPTKIIGDLFYSGNDKLASSELGKHSAEKGLKGIYNIFIKIASPAYIMKRASLIFNTYYFGTTFEVLESTNNSSKMLMKGFNSEETLVFERTEGWIKQLGVMINLDFKIIKDIRIEKNNAECVMFSKW